MQVSISERCIMDSGVLKISCNDGSITFDFGTNNARVQKNDIGLLGVIPPMAVPMKDLNHLSWTEIDEIGRSGKARDLFAVGATKRDTMKNGFVAEWKIIGFNHDDLADGSGKAAISWDMVRAYKDEWAMNDESTNEGGWEKCKMNQRMNGELLALCSDELQSIIKPVIKLTSAGKCSKEIIKSVCKLWLKSEKELYGRCFYSAPGEGSWYEYYRQEDVPYYIEDADGDRVSQWLRSANYTNYHAFCLVYTDGSASYYTAWYASALSPGFCS